MFWVFSIAIVVGNLWEVSLKPYGFVQACLFGALVGCGHIVDITKGTRKLLAVLLLLCPLLLANIIVMIALTEWTGSPGVSVYFASSIIVAVGVICVGPRAARPRALGMLRAVVAAWAVVHVLFLTVPILALRGEMGALGDVFYTAVFEVFVFQAIWLFALWMYANSKPLRRRCVAPEMS